MATKIDVKVVRVLQLVSSRLSQKELVSLLFVSSWLNRALSSSPSLWQAIDLREMQNAGERPITALSLNLSDEGLCHLAKYKRMTSLNLTWCIKITDGVLTIAHGCKGLEFMRCLEALSKSCAHSLTTLDVNGCTGIKRRSGDDLLKLSVN